MNGTAYICAKVVAGLWLLGVWLNDRPALLYKLNRIGLGPKTIPIGWIDPKKPPALDSDEGEISDYFKQMYRNMGDRSGPLVHTNNRGTF